MPTTFEHTKTLPTTFDKTPKFKHHEHGHEPEGPHKHHEPNRPHKHHEPNGPHKITSPADHINITSPRDLDHT